MESGVGLVGVQRMIRMKMKIVNDVGTVRCKRIVDRECDRNRDGGD